MDVWDRMHTERAEFDPEGMDAPKYLT
jgi:hypothetical protein